MFEALFPVGCGRPGAWGRLGGSERVRHWSGRGPMWIAKRPLFARGLCTFLYPALFGAAGVAQSRRMALASLNVEERGRAFTAPLSGGAIPAEIRQTLLWIPRVSFRSASPHGRWVAAAKGADAVWLVEWTVNG